MITAGAGTLTVGGTIPDGKTTQHEIPRHYHHRGRGQKGQTGDVLTIPAKMPHQMKVERGKQISYLAIKVAQ